MLHLRYKSNSIIKIASDIPYGATCVLDGVETEIKGSIFLASSDDKDEVNVVFTDFVPVIDFRRSNIIAVLSPVLPVKSLTCMFEGCRLLTTVCEDLLINNTEHTNLTGMFKNCESFDINKNLGVFKPLKSVKSVNHMLDNTGIKLLDNKTLAATCFDNLTTAVNLCSNCCSLRYINSDSISRLTKLVFIDGIFKYCVSLQSIPNGTFSSLTMLKSATGAFKAASSLKVVNKNLGCEFPSSCNITGMFTGTKIRIHRK